MGLPINKVLPSIEQIVDDLGYVLYDIEEDKLGTNDVMRILVQRQDGEGVDLDDCVKITHGLTPTLDNHPSLKDEYMLEVASPGVIRPLSKDFHFEQVLGETIEVTTYHQLDGFDTKKISGKLVLYNETSVTIDDFEIKRSEIKKASTTFEF